MEKKVLEWFVNGETGVSSEAMAAAVCGIRQKSPWPGHPSDPSDFNRCVKFLKAVPEARQHFDKVAEMSKVWAALVEHWDELEKMLAAEWPTGSAPKMYERMKALGC